MRKRADLNREQIEEGKELALDFTKLEQVAACGQHLVPVAIQDADSGEMLILGYANQQALEHTLAARVATLWSTSRDELWIKGSTSGDYLDVVEVRVNCEQNSLLYRVRPRGKGACHTHDRTGAVRWSCFYRKIAPDGSLQPP